MQMIGHLHAAATLPIKQEPPARSSRDFGGAQRRLDLMTERKSCLCREWSARLRGYRQSLL